MNLLTNNENEDICQLGKLIEPSFDYQTRFRSSYHQLHDPYRIQFATFHPNDDANTFLLSSIAPSGIIYSSLNRSECEGLLASNLHQHEYYELLFVLQGNVFQTIENQRHFYPEGSCCFLNTNVRHTEEFSTDFRIAFLQLSKDFLRDFYSDYSMCFFDIEKTHVLSDFELFLRNNITEENPMEKNYLDLIPVRDNQWIIKNIHKLFNQITKETISPVFGSSFLIKGFIFKLIHLLSSTDNFETTPVQIGTELENQLYNQITQILETSHGHTTRSELAEQLHYTGDYLNRIVKKYTGLSIFDYGMTFCMKEAASQLANTHLPIAEISTDLGFSNRTHFYQVFKKTYHLTPAQYRKQNSLLKAT